MKRYCKKCLQQRSAVAEGVLPKELFGVNIMAQVCNVWCLAIPYENIEKTVYMLYERFIEVSNVIHMCDTAADQLKPLYDELLQRVAYAPIINCDDTGWY